MLDSIDKIVTTYFNAVSRDRFTYKGASYGGHWIMVSPNFFHEFKCVMNCAGCCKRITLDWLPTETRPANINTTRKFQINGKDFEVFSVVQKSGPIFCDHVNRETGACEIHGVHPFSCDFETLRFVNYGTYNWLGVRPFGRGWAMGRVDNHVGALCEFSRKATEEARLEGIRKLKRLKEWTDYIGLDTYIPEIINWATECKTKPLHLYPERSK